MTFRRRILIAMLPLFVLLVALGATGTFLIYHLGDQVGKILTENYDSVVFMRDLNEALERIDSSFQFALAGREEQSPSSTGRIGRSTRSALDGNSGTSPFPAKENWSSQLDRTLQSLPNAGRHFYTTRVTAADRDALYFGKDKDPDRRRVIRDVSGDQEGFRRHPPAE